MLVKRLAHTRYVTGLTHYATPLKRRSYGRHLLGEPRFAYGAAVEPAGLRP
jgi:hypothetical protein